MPRFGLIGHGVVGSLFARLLGSKGAEVLSYDVLLDNPEKSASARARIQADHARAADLEETVGSSDYLLALTPTQGCVQAARRAAVMLRPEQVYCDFASTSPAIKQEIAGIVAPSGAIFVEGAILGAVGATLSCPAILLGGEAASRISDVLNSYGLKTSAYSNQIGPASAFKMIRSVFSKGMETLLIETLVSARRAGLLDQVWDEIRATLAPDRMEKMLETWIRSHAISSGRRYGEMQEVSRYLEELRVPPLITRAAAEMFRRSTELGIAGAFESEPQQFTDVIDFLAERVSA
jgi:3-hydroxyisobutyrate dehydrogenase-like beta-hydroxyacid dehydrogenase